MTGTVDVQDGSLYYEISGAGPFVVFAHGLAGNHNSWWQQVPYFARRYTCLTFAHRGFSPSQDATGCPRPELYAGDLATMLGDLGIERAHLVAQSMGGWTAMEFALRAPDRVSSLVLCGSTGTLKHPDLVPLVTTDPHVAPEAHPAAGGRMAREQPDLYRRFVGLQRQTGDWDRDQVRRSLNTMRIRTPDELATLRHNLLMLVGAEDVVCPPANLDLLSQAVPHHQLAVIPEAGHSVYYERPTVFNETVMAFLDSSDRQ